jgi:hypothetical protein
MLALSGSLDIHEMGPSVFAAMQQNASAAGPGEQGFPTKEG